MTPEQPPQRLKAWVYQVAQLLEDNRHLEPEHYTYLIQEPELALSIITLIDAQGEADEEDPSEYSACILAFDICVAQLQAAVEANNKLAAKTLQQTMSHLARVISSGHHSLGFWLPILNAFYEVHADLSDELQEAYYHLASDEDSGQEADDVTPLNSIRDVIHELSDLSEFDIAENFFAQSYAMPPDFFIDLVLDLYSLEEGQEIGLLALLHPKHAVREVVVATLDQLIDHVTLSSLSLSRLQAIKNWYPETYHSTINRWIKVQRKKGVTFCVDKKMPTLRIKASEVDGTGSQGLFIHGKYARKNQLCGLLFKLDVGIKDAWITPDLSIQEVARHYDESFDDNVTLRKVDQAYLVMMTNHFLAVTIHSGDMPNLHLLEIQEALGMSFHPQYLDIAYLMEQLAVQISPFTPDTVYTSLQRSKNWPKNKRFTESWYLESPKVDGLVNRCCTFVDGVKVCRFEEAIALVFSEEMEQKRERWMFHFLWIALWLKAGAGAREKAWQDSFFIAHTIQAGEPLETIPIMREICYQSVVNSIETMQERRTHLL